MGTISLEGVEFYAFHGVYEEERQIGNRFVIDIHIDTNLEKASISDSLTDTVDYERVYLIMTGVMENSSNLLENIAHNIIRGVRQAYPFVGEITVKVAKLNPPIGAICRSASVTLKG
ncbi:MAG: dihydroneopterin aldolase [Spirosomataceae bacterium]